MGGMTGESGDSGLVYLGTWHLQTDLSIKYVVRCHPPQAPSAADVFVCLDEAVKMLTDVTGRTVRPPNIETIWTINTADSDLDLCPLSEFVYQAALKASEKKFRKVYDGILNVIMQNLYIPSQVNELCPYTEGSSGSSSSRKTEDVMGWSEMEEMLQIPEEVLDQEEIKDQDDVKYQEEVLDQEEIKYQEEEEVDDKSSILQVEIKSEPEGEKSDENLNHPTTVRVTKRKKRKREERNHEKYNCSICDKTFEKLLVLLKHCKKEHPEEPGQVKLEQLEILHERKTVREEEEAGEMFVCGLSLCSLKFERYLSLVGHERTHVDAYICILCGHCCQSAENLIAHSDSQHPRKSQFICRVCGFFNRKSDQLATHVQQEHMAGSVMFQCEESDCQFVTEKKQSLHAHKRTAHNEQEYYCHICGKNYASAASLYVHRKSHEPDFKKFQCKLCPRTFAYSSGLSYHMAVHTGEKPFSCPQCGKTFGSHTSLSRHVRVLHAEEKDMVYQCEHCGKKFPKRMGREYKDHVKIHTGERDHICSICGSGYFSRKMLRKHELKKHQNLLPKKAQPVRINPETVPQLQVQPNSCPLSLQAAQAAGVPLQNIPKRSSLQPQPQPS